jgi:hypothetical protein
MNKLNLLISTSIYCLAAVVASNMPALARGGGHAGGGHVASFHPVGSYIAPPHPEHHPYDGSHYYHGYGRGWNRGYYGGYGDYVNPYAWGSGYGYGNAQVSSELDTYNRSQSERLSQLPTNAFVQNYYWPGANSQSATQAAPPSPTALSATAGRLDDGGLPPLRHLNGQPVTRGSASEGVSIPPLRHLSGTNSGSSYK